MIHIPHPKILVRLAPAPMRTLRFAARRASDTESLAAPLTLAAVVVGTIVLAAAVALITALGA